MSLIRDLSLAPSGEMKIRWVERHMPVLRGIGEDFRKVVEVVTNEAIGETNAGVAIYIDSSGLATKTSTSNTLLGYTRAAVGSTDLSFEVVCA